MSYLVRVTTIAVMKHHDQKQRGRTGLIQLTFPHHRPPLNKVRTGTQIEQKLIERPRRGDAYFLDPHGFLSLVFIAPMTTSPEVASCIMGLAFPY